MFKKLDNFLIHAAEKKKGKEISFLDRIFRNRFILILVSMVLIYRTVDHAISSYEHHFLLLCGFYVLLAAILLVAVVRHHFFKKKIVTLELFITFFEAALFCGMELSKSTGLSKRANRCVDRFRSASIR